MGHFKYVIFKKGRAWSGDGWTADKYQTIYYDRKTDADADSRLLSPADQIFVSKVDIRILFR